MKALILAAGYGTRLASIAKDTPKPLLPINGKPMIDYIVDRIKGINGLSEVVVVTNNKFYDQFVVWSKTQKDCTVRIVNDGTNSPEERLGSVGDINFVFKKEASLSDWLVVGGDNLFDTSANDFVNFAKSKTPAVSIGVYDIGNIAEAVKFGVSKLGEGQRVVSFQEKPVQPASSLITMCLYYFPQETLAYLDEYKKQSKAMDAAGSYIQWLVETKCVYGFQFQGTWYDIGSVESLQLAKTKFRP